MDDTSSARNSAATRRGTRNSTSSPAHICAWAFFGLARFPCVGRWPWFMGATVPEGSDTAYGGHSVGVLPARRPIRA